jgi:hypothetical protein
VLARLAPWAITIGIFAFLFSRYPIGQVVETLSGARWGLYLALMVPYSVYYLLIDTFVVQTAVGWFNIRVPYRDMLPVRATTYILSLVNTSLGSGGVAAYLNRRHGIPFWQVTGTVVFIMLIEIYQLGVASFVGAVASGTPPALLRVYTVMALYLVGHLWFFSRPRGERLTGLPILAAFWKARPIQYLLLLCCKLPNLLGAVVVYWLALPLFGIDGISFVSLLTYLPIIFFVAAVPVAAAHLGPAQWAWPAFFAAGDEQRGAALVAFSLAAHLMFMVMNALLGVVFLRRASRELAAE